MTCSLVEHYRFHNRGHYPIELTGNVSAIKQQQSRTLVSSMAAAVSIVRFLPAISLQQNSYSFTTVMALQQAQQVIDGSGRLRADREEAWPERTIRVALHQPDAQGFLDGWKGPGRCLA